MRATEILTTVLPTSLGYAVASTVRFLEIEITNNTGESAIVEVQNGSGLSVIPPQVLADKAVLTYEQRYGRTMVGGIKWSSSVAGVTGTIFLCQ